MLGNVEIGQLRGGAGEFAPFTFPRYRHFLEDGGRAVLAIRAAVGSVPVGLALWYLDEDDARLLSIRVRPDWRRLGIARQLLRVSDAHLPKGMTRIVYWSSRVSQVAGFERLLVEEGWGAKELDEYRCRFSPASVEAWVLGRTGARVGYRIGGSSFALWDDLAEADHREIALLEERYADARLFSPREFPLDREFSAALKVHGATVGWCLTEKVGAELWYDRFWTRPEFVRSGAQLGLLLFMIRRQGALLGPDSIGRFCTTERRPGMLALVRGPLHPIFTWHDEFWMAKKPAAEAEPLAG